MKRIYSLFFALLLAGPALAQFNLGLHQFTGVPQSTFTNPAIMPQAKFFIGLPVVNSFYVNYYNPSFVMDDIIREVGDSSMLDFSKLYEDRAGKTFSFNVEQQSDLFHLGFRMGRKNFLSFGAYQVLQTSYRLPVDLLRLVQNGSLDPYFRENPVSLNDIDINVKAYVAYHIGYAREINSKLSVGGRFKYLSGIAGGQVEYAQGGINWQTDSLVVTNNFRYNASNLNTLGGGGNLDIGGLAFSTGNNGMAFDFGLAYKVTKRLMITASVTDMGSIRWANDLTSIVSDSSSYTYSGGTINVGENDNGDPFSGVIDSLSNAFKFDRVEPGKEFTTQLNSRYLVSASYEFLKGNQVGVMFSGNRYNEEFYPAFTAFYQSKIWNLLFLRANYTVSPGSFDNLGGALAVKLGPVQLYTVADNLLALGNQGNVSTFNVRLGLNILFGMRGYKDKSPASEDVESFDDN